MANPARVLKIIANIESAPLSKKHKAASSNIADVEDYCHTGKSLNLGKNVELAGNNKLGFFRNIVVC